MADLKAILKKAFWIFLGILGIALVILIVIPLFARNKNKGESPIRDIIEKTQLEVDKAEITAQIEKATAKGKEEAVIQALEHIKQEPDRKKRLERLSSLL